MSILLGTGLWGEVIDLEDGTVLKLTRRKCAGIGDGLVKLQREVEVLHAFEAINEPLPISVARVQGWGTQRQSLSSRELPQVIQSDDDRKLWLRTTKLLGYARTASELEWLPRPEKGEIAGSMATAIASIHTLLQQASVQLNLPSAEASLLMLLHEVEDDAEGSKYIEQLLKILETMRKLPQMPIHGDLNISNLLFNRNEITAVVDFAETRQGFYEEDIAALISELPGYREQLIEAIARQTGHVVDERKLRYGLALKALLSFLIARRLRVGSSLKIEQENLEHLLKILK
ncbi:MAG: phosphotransferase [Cyanobacteria bacterium J06623_4]